MDSKMTCKSFEAIRLAPAFQVLALSEIVTVCNTTFLENMGAGGTVCDKL